MKLYDSIGPNPRLVRLFMAEKGIAVDKIDVDILGGENREAAFLAQNPAGELPALLLDDGTILAETQAICEYLEECYPEHPLIGETAETRAKIRMWVRRVDVNINAPLTNGFRYAEGLPLFQSRRHCIPQAADDLKIQARQGMVWLEAQLQDRPYIAGYALSLADITLFPFLDFGRAVGQPIDPALTPKLAAWFDRIAERPAVAASLHHSERR